MPTLTNPDSTIELKDGRTLGYAEYGDPNGKPVFFFHGFPSSRLEGRNLDAAGEKLGARIITPERPGFGLSDYKPERTIADWAGDVVELADALGIDRFAVLGISGGGPYVAACARFIPERLTGAAIVAGTGPFDEPSSAEGMNPLNRRVFTLAHRTPWLYRLLMRWMTRNVQRDPEGLLSQIIDSMPEVDQAMLNQSEHRQAYKEIIQEAFRGGNRGAIWEGILFARPWGFRLEDIPIGVHLWQGELDTNVPPSMGHYQAQAIPHCQARFFPEEGHMSLQEKYVEDFIGVLVG